jgi:hypothetical protein
LIAVDTDVLAIHYIFTRDKRQPVTTRFLERASESGYGVPIFSLLELCGLMVTASESKDAMKLFDLYLASERTGILYPPVALRSGDDFWALQNAALLNRIQRGMRLGDAAILWTVEATGCDTIVTWNTRHYQGKTHIPVQSPHAWLAETTSRGM